MWYEALCEPVASTREEAIQYIDAELARAVPEGWRVSRASSAGLTWRIEMMAHHAEGVLESDYRLELSQGLDLVVFTYGNSDAGPWPRLFHCLQLSLTIRGGALRHFGMAACLQHLMQHFEPNRWGLS